ncbi:hypothetical protein EV126DRAFT_341671, partial [Verticillium dahliae]
EPRTDFIAAGIAFEMDLQRWYLLRAVLPSNQLSAKLFALSKGASSRFSRQTSIAFRWVSRFEIWMREERVPWRLFEALSPVFEEVMPLLYSRITGVSGAPGPVTLQFAVTPGPQPAGQHPAVSPPPSARAAPHSEPPSEMRCHEGVRGVRQGRPMAIAKRPTLEWLSFFPKTSMYPKPAVLV